MRYRYNRDLPHGCLASDSWGAVLIVRPTGRRGYASAREEMIAERGPYTVLVDGLTQTECDEAAKLDAAGRRALAERIKARRSAQQATDPLEKQERRVDKRFAVLDASLKEIERSSEQVPFAVRAALTDLRDLVAQALGHPLAKP